MVHGDNLVFFIVYLRRKLVFENFRGQMCFVSIFHGIIMSFLREVKNVGANFDMKASLKNIARAYTDSEKTFQT